MMLFTTLRLATLAAGSPAVYNAQPYAHHTRQASYNNKSLEVDLGYSVYKGYANSTANLNVFQGYLEDKVSAHANTR